MNDLPLNEVIEGDCIEVMEHLPSDSVDLVFADPPYNLQLNSDLWRPNHTKVDAVDDAWDHFDNLQAYDGFTRRWLCAARRVLKDTGTIWVIGSYHNIYRVGNILMDLDFWILNDIIWIKTNPMPNFHGVRFTNAHETLIWAQKERGAKYTFNYHVMKALNGELQMRSDWIFPICKGKERLRVDGEKVHSTQKPEALLHRIIIASTNPGDVILDPFFGTGTTGAVARKLHRNWVGIEICPLYVEIARQRIEAICPPPYCDDVFKFEDRRSKPRVVFGRLLEHGLLEPGQKLYFGEQGTICATILANGKLKLDDQVGSIHQLGRQLTGGSCNGWQEWFYEDAVSGKRVVIDLLREKLRALLDLET